jgi:hypothetical protein
MIFLGPYGRIVVEFLPRLLGNSTHDGPSPQLPIVKCHPPEVMRPKNDMPHVCLWLVSEPAAYTEYRSGNTVDLFFFFFSFFRTADLDITWKMGPVQLNHDGI